MKSFVEKYCELYAYLTNVKAVSLLLDWKELKCFICVTSIGYDDNSPVLKVLKVFLQDLFLV